MEKWKDVADYEGLYMVSNLGNIKNKNNKILKLTTNKKGYLKTNLSKNGKLKTVFPHRLVAEHFVPNPNNLPQVNHKNENKQSNEDWNLEWCTNQYNLNYGTARQRCAEKRRRAVTIWDLQKNILQDFNSVSDAANELKCNSGIICKVCKRKNHKYKNYIITYK